MAATALCLSTETELEAQNAGDFEGERVGDWGVQV